MQDTNIQINEQELKAIQDTAFFDTKKVVSEKINNLLTELQDELATLSKSYSDILPKEVFYPGGKISKGENYLGYPYLILDYPRVFEKENIFAFRSMFWWGNHFSYTLHVGGKYYEEAKEMLIQNIDSLRLPDLYICVNSDQWEYHFDKENYEPTINFDIKSFLLDSTNEKSFIKLSFKTDLTQWHRLKSNGLYAFKLFVKAFSQV